jgi:hypothetical protein
MINNIKQVQPAIPVQSIPASNSIFVDCFADTKPSDCYVSPILEFEYDPLSLVVEAVDKNVALMEIHAFLTNQAYETHNDLGNMIITESSLERSKKIRSYFKNRLFMRRLKNQYISDYMVALEAVLENPNSINTDSVAILVKLPDFYREGQETDAIFNVHNSVDKRHNNWTTVNDEFTFVGKVKRYTKQQNRTRFYFANKQKNLLMHETFCGDQQEKMIEFMISTNPKLGFTGYAKLTHQPGYEHFLLYNNGRYDFYVPNS